MHQSQISLFGWPNAFEVLDSFFHFFHLSSLSDMWKSLMLPLPTRGYCWGKSNTYMGCRCSAYHWRPQIVEESLDSCIKTYHHQHRQGGGERKICSGESSLGHWHRLPLQWPFIQLWTWNGRTVSNQFWFFFVVHVALLVTCIFSTTLLLPSTATCAGWN